MSDQDIKTALETLRAGSGDAAADNFAADVITRADALVKSVVAETRDTGEAVSAGILQVLELLGNIETRIDAVEEGLVKSLAASEDLAKSIGSRPVAGYRSQDAEASLPLGEEEALNKSRAASVTSDSAIREIAGVLKKAKSCNAPSMDLDRLNKARWDATKDPAAAQDGVKDLFAKYAGKN